MDFSVRLEQLLEENNITQKQLAFDLHIASSTINGYIKNYREPDFGMLVRLAQYFTLTSTIPAQPGRHAANRHPSSYYRLAYRRRGQKSAR